MSPTSRRIFLYWLLLLVPTLVAGAAALFWLRREQQRIAAQGSYALEARKSAVIARASLVVENVELLVGDVQDGLLDALATVPAAQVDATFAEWERSNPLVRVGFRAQEDGRLLRPLARGAIASGTDDPLERFVRRFGDSFAAEPPWADALLGRPAKAEQKRSSAATDRAERPATEAEASRLASTRNYAQVQSARREVQNLLRNQDFDVAMPEAARGGVYKVAPAPGRAAAAKDKAEADMMAGAPLAAGAQEQAARPPSGAAPALRGRVVRTEPGTGRLELLAWVRPAGARQVRGVEIDLAALISRLGAALPAETVAGEGFALRDNRGRTLHQAGLVPRTGEPVVTLPLAKEALPGFEVLGYLTADAGSSMEGRAFFWIGVVLVGIFVAAVAGGGSLLLWQARRSDAEAVQKTSFVANVSHEFKTPLTTIRLYSELLEQGRVRDEAKAADYLRTIGRETQRLARLVNNALDFSRLEQGRKKYALERVDLKEVIGRLLDTYTPRLAEAGMALERTLPETPVVVTTDRDAVEQIAINLLDNACKYAAEGRVVTVALAAGDTGVGASLTVADRGPGVPPEQKERIFEKFHRVDETLTAEKSGTGLGLSIARQLARGLGGELHYQPRPGGGAEFVLRLPCNRHAAGNSDQH